MVAPHRRDIPEIWRHALAVHHKGEIGWEEMFAEPAEVVLTEVNFIPIYRDAPLLSDVVRFFAEAGFRAYDLATLYRRPLDGALWQTDIVFVRNASRLISSVQYE